MTDERRRRSERRTDDDDPDLPPLRWRHRIQGPALLLAGYAVTLDTGAVDRLGVPAPPSFGAGMLLCIDGSGQAWSRVGEAATVMALVAGYQLDPAHVGRMLPFVRHGWPQHWPEPLIANLVPDPLPQQIAIKST